jgi:hypothetical protein
MYKVMRGLGVALIAMPEPFTTPLGVGLLAASIVLAKRQESKRRAYLRHLLKEYVRSYRRLRPENRYNLESLPFKRKEPLFQTSTGPASRVGLQGYPWPNRAKLDPIVVHHVLDVSRAQRRFSSGGSRRGFEGYWGANSYQVIRPQATSPQTLRPNQRSPRPAMYSLS